MGVAVVAATTLLRGDGGPARRPTRRSRSVPLPAVRGQPLGRPDGRAHRLRAAGRVRPARAHRRRTRRPSSAPNLAAFVPGKVIDGDPTTSWKEGAPDETGEWIEVTFDPATVTSIVRRNGYNKSETAYRGNPRLRAVADLRSTAASRSRSRSRTRQPQRVTELEPVDGATTRPDHDRVDLPGRRTSGAAQAVRRRRARRDRGDGGHRAVIRPAAGAPMLPPHESIAVRIRARPHMSAIGASVGRAVGGLGGPATTAAIVVGRASRSGRSAAGSYAERRLPVAASRRARRASCRCTRAPTPAPSRRSRGRPAGARDGPHRGRRPGSGSTTRRPGRTEAWVEAGPLTVDGSVASLPVAELRARSSRSRRRRATARGVDDRRPGRTRRRPPTPAPTPTPRPGRRPGRPRRRTRGPTVASLTASTRQISFDTARYCPNAVKTSHVPRPRDGRGRRGRRSTLFWREPGAAAFAQAPMNRVSGTAARRHLGGDARHGRERDRPGRQPRLLRDGARRRGATRRIPATGSNAIQVKVCENDGPGRSRPSTSSSGNTLFWNPLGAPGNCQTATQHHRDGQGHRRRARRRPLFYRRPGDAATSRSP